MSKELKAKDLRIGNIVGRGYMNPTPTGLKKEYQICQVKSLGIEMIITNAKIGSKEMIKGSYGNIRPIELTEEWLVKLGAKPLPHKNILNSHIIDLGRNRLLSVSVHQGNTMIWLNELNPSDHTEITDLVCVFNEDYDGELYVHRLQNLVHSLTQTELQATKE